MNIFIVIMQSIMSHLSRGSIIQARNRRRVNPLVPSLTVWLLAPTVTGGGGALDRVSSCSKTARSRK